MIAGRQPTDNRRLRATKFPRSPCDNQDGFTADSVALGRMMGKQMNPIH